MEGFVSVKDFESHFETLGPPFMRYYVNEAAGLKITHRENERAFQRLRLLPSVLKDVSKLDMSTTILGQKVSMPIGVSPTSAQRFYWRDGEQSTFEAVERSGVCGILSNFTSTTLEEIEKMCPSGRKWLNVYLWRDREALVPVIKEAESRGFTAIVVTADSPVGSATYEMKKNPLPGRNWYRLVSEGSLDPAKHNRTLFNAAATWSDVDWLRTVTSLPIVMKGILSARDAVLAVQHGAAAILVSNHGGRLLDTVPATIEVLPSIVDAVGDRAEVYMDGGVRMGTDVVKALALGARAVFVGRPVVWGLAGWGTEGVLKILQILKEELRIAMSLLGCYNLEALDRSKVLGVGKSQL